jgi:hypothetical protein
MKALTLPLLLALISSSASFGCATETDEDSAQGVQAASRSDDEDIPSFGHYVLVSRPKEGAFKELTLLAPPPGGAKNVIATFSRIDIVKKGTELVDQPVRGLIRAIPNPHEKTEIVFEFVTDSGDAAGVFHLFPTPGGVNPIPVAPGPLVAATQFIMELTESADGEKAFRAKCSLHEVLDSSVFEESLTLEGDEDADDVSVQRDPATRLIQVGIGINAFNSKDEKITLTRRSATECDISITTSTGLSVTFEIRGKKGSIRAHERGTADRGIATLRNCR